MQSMVDFSIAILNAIADFLMQEPIFYVFSLICFAFIIDIFLKLIKNLR